MTKKHQKMVILIKTAKVSNSVSSLIKFISNVSLNKTINVLLHRNRNVRLAGYSESIKLLHTSTPNNDLNEFFDKEPNWTKSRIPTGRSWKTDELRIKSNEDLHKLWYVLLKERNMLLTMEYACNQAYELFPNPERIDKVEESMKNLEGVIRERNEAYYKLETGESGEQPSKFVWNTLGMKQYYRLRQYIIPKFMNKRWKEIYMLGYNGYAVRKFQRLYREKIWNLKRKELNREKNSVIQIIRKFPNVDRDALHEKYPNLQLDRILKSNKLKSVRDASRYE